MADDLTADAVLTGGVTFTGHLEVRLVSGPHTHSRWGLDSPHPHLTLLGERFSVVYQPEDQFVRLCPPSSADEDEDDITVLPAELIDYLGQFDDGERLSLSDIRAYFQSRVEESS